MSLYLVGGIAGSGKSTLVHEFRSRQIEAHDVDYDGFAQMVHVPSGMIVERPPSPELRDEKWAADHQWQIVGRKVLDLAKDAKKNDVFLCGAAMGTDAYHHCFKKLFWLTIDNETLEYRIKTRTTNDFGKTPYELNEILAWNNEVDAYTKSRNMRAIDATKPTTLIADEILSVVQRTK